MDFFRDGNADIKLEEITGEGLAGARCKGAGKTEKLAENVTIDFFLKPPLDPTRIQPG